MKLQGRCPKCGQQQLGRLETLLDSARDRLDVSYQAVGTMSLPPQGGAASPARIKAGAVEAYLCPACGHLERYVQDVAWMPLSKLDGFSWVNGAPDTEEADR